MARLVMILGDSGTGKSTSLRNLKEGEANIASVTGKELPFRTTMRPKKVGNYRSAAEFVRDSEAPIVVIDDANYLMSFEEMSRVDESGYSKFSSMAKNFYSLVKYILDKESDQTFYLLAHSEENESGQLKIKTTGKMLSEKVVLEGLTSIVLKAGFIDGEFVFFVKTDGKGVKSPMGMFEVNSVPNDLKAINDKIVSYYSDMPTKKVADKPKTISKQDDKIKGVKAPTPNQISALKALKYDGDTPKSFDEAKEILVRLQQNVKK